MNVHTLYTQKKEMQVVVGGYEYIYIQKEKINKSSLTLVPMHHSIEKSVHGV